MIGNGDWTIARKSPTKENNATSLALAQGSNGTSHNAPIAGNEFADPDRFWKDDPCDDILPTERGFVSDMIYYTRGREVATLFMVWSALFAISSAVKREAWMKWADGKLFPNIYCMIVAPAGAVKKNTAIDIAIKCLDYIDNEIDDPNIAGMKAINPFMSKATPEALVTAMLPSSKRVKDFALVDQHGRPMIGPDGNVLKYYAGSDLIIAQHELGTMVGKQSYMEGLTDMLTNFYDCHDRWSNLTQGRGNEELSNLYVTFMAATTPTAVKESLPTAAVGDGFLSRTVLAYQAFTDRVFDEPIVPDGAPGIDDLRKRLAWIASHTFGEWRLSPEARAYYKIMYHRFKHQNAVDGMYQGLKSRQDIIIRKVAMLIRWQRYERDDKLISLQDVIDAEYIVKRTFQESAPMYRNIISDQQNDHVLKAEEYIRRVKKTARKEVMRRGHCNSDDVTEAVNQLVAEGRVKVYLDGKEKHQAGRNSDEVYEWQEESKPSKQDIVCTITEFSNIEEQSFNSDHDLIATNDMYGEADGL